MNRFVFKFFSFFLSVFCYSNEEKSVVIGKLYGQLGNQFFQIAATLSLALDNNAIAVFPDLKTEPLYNIPLNYAKVFQRLNSSLSNKITTTIYKESTFDFHPIPYIPNMEINGYFQSEKYFKHHKDEILALFSPSEEITTYLYSKYNKIIDHPKTVSVHIRMYRDAKPEYHPFVGWNYILEAMKCFDNDSLFIIFSDEILFCKKKLTNIIQNKNIVFIEGNSHYHDLYLMSFCKNHILSNSSFSWWGAYLNKNEKKIILCPSPTRWFGKSLPLNTKDLLPSEWTVLF